jgi:carbonic anhydrase
MMTYSSNDNISSEEALKRLLNGNKRYISAVQSHPNQTPKRRSEIARGQLPFAAILGCSDSRVPPEIIFDQGLGDLFVIRIAGNLIDDMVLGSLEYAAIHLHTPLIMVLWSCPCCQTNDQC